MIYLGHTNVHGYCSRLLNKCLAKLKNKKEKTNYFALNFSLFFHLNHKLHIHREINLEGKQIIFCKGTPKKIILYRGNPLFFHLFYRGFPLVGGKLSNGWRGDKYFADWRKVCIFVEK